MDKTSHVFKTKRHSSRARGVSHDKFKGSSSQTIKPTPVLKEPRPDLVPAFRATLNITEVWSVKLTRTAARSRKHQLASCGGCRQKPPLVHAAAAAGFDHLRRGGGRPGGGAGASASGLVTRAACCSPLWCAGWLGAGGQCSSSDRKWPQNPIGYANVACVA